MKIIKQINPKNRLILLIFIFAFFSRLLVQPYFIKEKKDFADGLYYNSYAIVEILNDKGWAEKNSDEIDNLRAPGYPLFLALIYSLFGIENFKMVYLFQTVLSLWLAYFIYRLSYQIFKNENIALVSLTWSLFYLPTIRYSFFIGRDSLIFFLFFISIYFGFNYLSKDNKKYFLYFLLSFVYLIHTDPRYLLFIPVIIFPLYDIFGLKSGLIKYFNFIFLLCLLLLPWTVRNYIYFDGLVIISPKYLDFRKKNTFTSQDEFKDNYTVKDFMLSSAGKGDQSFTIKNKIDVIYDDEKKLILEGENPKNRSLKVLEAVRSGKGPADSYISKRFWMLKQFWRVTNFNGDFFPYPSGIFTIWSLKHNIVNIIFYGILLPFFIFSIIFNFNKKSSDIKYFMYIIFYQCVIHTFIWSRVRYRHPIDPLIIILGVNGMFLFYQFLNGSKIFKNIK